MSEELKDVLYTYHATGSIGGVYKYGCELFKKRIECAVMLNIANSEE